MEKFRAKVEKIRQLTHDVRELRLRLIEPDTIAFKPGQFISFEVPHGGSRRLVTRPYSIASPPTQGGAIDLVLNFVEGGPGSTYLFSLHPDDETTFKGPAGSFYLRESARNLLFVATGTGIAPLRSMLYTLVERGDVRPAMLFWGVRSERDLYYQDDLERLVQKHPTFRFLTTLSRPEGRWRGSTGRVTGLVEQHVASVHNLEAYLCGNSGMIKDVTAVLNRKGLCPIHREKYYDDKVGEQPD
jgi:NAD(P)H-flavin reductase